MDMRTRFAELSGKSRECLRAVDQRLERAPGPWRRLTGGPELPIRRLEGTLPAESSEPSDMMRTDQPLDAAADELVEGEQWVGHRQTLCP